MSIREYKTLAALSAAGLDESIAQHLDFGWQPWGDPYVAVVDGAGYIHQVMVRSDEDCSDDLVRVATLVIRALQGDLMVQGD